MTHILVITPSYDPKLGGVEKHVWHTSQELKKRGFQLTILTQRFANLPAKEVKEGITIHRLVYPRARFLGLLVIWWRLFVDYWQLIDRADIIHIHDVFIWYLPVRLLFWRKKIVTTFHGWEGIFPVPWKNIFIRQIGALLSSKTVAIGQYLEKYYRFKADEIIYGGVTVPRNLLKKANVLLYVGRLSYDTGLPVLLQALTAGAWPGKVIFCGDGLLREAAEQVGEVKGFVDPAPYLKQAKIVFAGGYLSILEALAYRCAVVAAEKNPLKKDYYLMSPFATWLTVVNTPEDLAGYLKSALAGNLHRRDQIDQAFTWVKTQTWQKVADVYEKFYRELS
jgi:glycosyltransferase involved in cell wall biosynthesis